MKDKYVIDLVTLGHPLDDSFRISRSNRRRRERAGLIVAAATAWPFENRERPTPLECGRCKRRRPPCPGRLHVEFHGDDEDVTWSCPECGAVGAVRGWQDGYWDFLPELFDPPIDWARTSIRMGMPEYEALRRMPWYDVTITRPIMAAEMVDDGVELWATDLELELLLETAMEEAVDVRGGGFDATLDRAVLILAGAMREFILREEKPARGAHLLKTCEQIMGVRAFECSNQMFKSPPPPSGQIS